MAVDFDEGGHHMAGYRSTRRILAFLGALTLTTSLGPARADECRPPWSIVPTPDGGSTGNAFYGVAGSATGDAWAVGTYFSDQEHVARSLIEHWDGAGWTISSHPEVGHDSFLLDVDMLEAADAWTVGYYHTENQKTFALHWDGSSWKPVPTVDVGLESSLWAVEMVSATDVWAVGSATHPAGGRTRPLIEHWDGSQWNVVDGPDPGTRSSSLVSVSAVSVRDVWAVGSETVGIGGSQTLIEHWDGASWTVVPGPNPSPSGDEMNDVAAVSADDVWAAGSMTIQSGDEARLIEHWNGSSWQVVSSPRLRATVLEGVASVSPTELWAVGTLGKEALTERSDGSGWLRVVTPSRGLSTTLHEVAAIASSDVWAVGSGMGEGGLVHTFALHHCG
jgi:hypothetical protein